MGEQSDMWRPLRHNYMNSRYLIIENFYEKRLGLDKPVTCLVDFLTTITSILSTLKAWWAFFLGFRNGPKFEVDQAFTVSHYGKFVVKNEVFFGRLPWLDIHKRMIDLVFLVSEIDWQSKSNKPLPFHGTWVFCLQMTLYSTPFLAFEWCAAQGQDQSLNMSKRVRFGSSYFPSSRHLLLSVFNTKPYGIICHFILRCVACALYPTFLFYFYLYYNLWAVPLQSYPKPAFLISPYRSLWFPAV